MKIVGLITEYNPFHNGHQYHIEKARELTGADAVVAIMSGNYVQRGAPAIMPKHIRTEMALKSGVSAVIELPVCYAVGSAEYFARGAVSLFNQLGCIDTICFGTECGDHDVLAKIAYVTADEPPVYKEMLQSFLREGIAFPLARQKALSAYFENDTLDTVLEQPNNILGIEYIKALYQSKSPIKPIAIQRKMSNYHDTELSESYGSASAIRRLLAFSGNSYSVSSDTAYEEPPLSSILTRLNEHVPAASVQLLSDSHRIRYPVYANDFSLLLKYKLLNESRESLCDYVDVSKVLANRIINSLNDYVSFEQFCDLLKTREITYSRISRSLFHILLNMKKETFERFLSSGTTSYAHVLGFRQQDSEVLGVLKEHGSIPLITRLTEQKHLTETGREMLEMDITASHIYESVITEKFKYPFKNEYLQPIIIV